MQIKREYTAVVLSHRQLAPDIFDLILETELAKDLSPGQFAGLYCRDGSRLLPRPISICDADSKEETVRLVYRTVGAGTGEFSKLGAGDELRLIGALGNSFPVDETAGKRIILTGGGLGVPPLLYLFKELMKTRYSQAPASVTAVMGYRSRSLSFLVSDFSSVGETILASDDGSLGIHGTVVDAIREHQLEADMVFSCGPLPMLRSLAAYCRDKKAETGNNIKCYVSLEERMACGVGACLGCVVPTERVNDHSRVRNARICADGPVFDTDVIDWSKI